MSKDWKNDDSIDPTPAQALAYIVGKAESWDDSGSDQDASKRTKRALAVVLAAMYAPTSDEDLDGLEHVTTFEEAWSKMEAKGYKYGRDALEQVRLGWDMRTRSMSARTNKASAAQVLFHHARNLVASRFGEDFSLMVTPPEHDRIGDPSDGWGVHVVRDNKSLIVEHRNVVGLGRTLEGALCDLIEMVHYTKLDDSDTALWRERKQKTRAALRETLMGLGLHELVALVGDDDGGG